ncbi:hypothetical protein PoB_000812900 [Plakobranchus ocellatus]|uniref:Uncharacterized protein n=1 Tax=Plakobranchus ocellatus TaxID=259542 RepID=A0AAV3YI11_9GAST|nr:hypothetical protein PoB_000812900 [Plakobranchus ocellatus]
MVHSSLRMRMLDPNQGRRTATRKVEMWFIRRIMKVSWTKRKTDAEVMDITGYKKSLLYIIRERQFKIFVHINRAGGLEKLLWSAKICGNKSRGSQKHDTQNRQTV